MLCGYDSPLYSRFLKGLEKDRIPDTATMSPKSKKPRTGSKFCG